MTTFVDRVTLYACAGKVEMVVSLLNVKNLSHLVDQMAVTVDAAAM